MKSDGVPTATATATATQVALGKDSQRAKKLRRHTTITNAGT